MSRIKIELNRSAVGEMCIRDRADSYGNGEYEVFPNVCILIMALFSATDLRNSYKEESKKSESDS